MDWKANKKGYKYGFNKDPQIRTFWETKWAHNVSLKIWTNFHPRILFDSRVFLQMWNIKEKRDRITERETSLSGLQTSPSTFHHQPLEQIRVPRSRRSKCTSHKRRQSIQVHRSKENSLSFLPISPHFITLYLDLFRMFNETLFLNFPLIMSS